MRIEKLETRGSWRDVADAARTTIGKESGEGEPSSSWKLKMLRCEHSPIRLIRLRWRWIDIPYWVSVHFVRHHVGIDHFVSTQRSDRTGQPRGSIPQSAPVTHECSANMQAMLDISRRRLCNLASPETRQAWQMVLEAIQDEQPELVELCGPDCQDGKCREFRPCGKNTLH
jgi:hypothetical protein